jgi:uncharacterized membrane protein YhaH (DUF805 family)
MVFCDSARCEAPIHSDPEEPSMGFVDAIRSCFANYVTMSGRAPRSEYWYFALLGILVGIARGILELILGNGIPDEPESVDVVNLVASLALLVPSLALFIPSITVTIRRLHDTDRSGWWWWILLIPIVGVIVLLVFMCQRGTQGPNRFGDDPLPATR